MLATHNLQWSCFSTHECISFSLSINFLCSYLVNVCIRSCVLLELFLSFCVTVYVFRFAFAAVVGTVGQCDVRSGE